MNNIIDNIIKMLNNAGRGFCDFSLTMFVQVSVLIVVLLIIDILIRKRVRATFRYWIWMLVFIKLILPPALSLPTGIGNWFGEYFVVNSADFDRQVQNINSAPEISIEPFDSEMPVIAEFSPQFSELTEIDTIPQASELAKTNTSIEPAISNASSMTWQGGIFLIWLVGVLVLSVLLIQRIFFVKGLIAQSEPAKNRLLETLEECSKQLGINKTIQMKLSHNASSPAVCGLFKPVILIPTNILNKISHKQFKVILIHELSHIKRADLWTNCVQTFLQILYFYNPLLWFANSIVRRIREQAVDEMVLVSLGADFGELSRTEAKSYTNTLIDVAEMAFSRPALSLRLVGVVESKKALSERIKLILSRPFPKTAKLGILGMVVIVLAAFILLPMAKADKISETNDTFIAAMPNDVTVELLGLNYIPVKDKMWWKSDGSPLQQVPYDKVDIDPSRDPNNDDFIYYTIAMQFDGRQPDDLGLIKWEFSGAEPHAGSSNGYKNGKIVYDENIHAGYARFPKDVEKTTLKLGITEKEWKTIFSGRHLGFYENGKDSANVSFAQSTGGPFGVSPGEKGVHIEIVYNITDSDFRVIAVDKAGKIHYSRRSGSGGTENLRKTTAGFPDLSHEQLDEFRFQVRGYDWIEFKDISLRPDEEVAALFEQNEERRNRELEQWFGQGQTRRIREQILILRECEIFKEMEKWTSAIRELVSIGKPAVPDLLEELKRTDNKSAKSTIAFTLRAIGDSDAVPVLIEVLGKSKYKGSYAVSVNDDTLLQFMKNNQRQPSTGGSLFTIGCPVIEITAALEKITGHTEGHEHFITKALNELGMDAEYEVVEKRNQEIIQDVANRWQNWWQENKDIGVSQNYPNNSFLTTLSNGISVELVGTCQYTDEGVFCYRSDGKPLGRNLTISKWNKNPQAGDTGIIFNVAGPEERKLSYDSFEGADGWEGSCDVLDENKEKIEGYVAVLTKFDKNRNTTKIRLGAATDAWKTIARHDGKSIKIDNGISFTKATETEQGVQIYTTDTLGRDVTQRIVAIDNNGKLHPWKGTTGSVSNSEMRQSIGTFPDLKLSQIKEFQFQTQPYEWVTFENIFLKPNDEQEDTTKSDILGYWSFDGNANDSSNNGNNGTVYGAILTEGISGSAYYFEGDGDCVSIPASEIFDFGNNDFSVSLWFKTSYPTDNFLMNFRQNDNNPHIEFYINNNIGTHLLPGNTRIEYPDAGVRDDKWHHLAATLEKSIYKLYLDGMEVGSQSYIGNLKDWDTITIGGRNNQSNDGFKGTIDEVGIYNKAMSAGQVKQLYEKFNQSEKIKLVSSNETEGLICYWDFEGDALDKVGQIQGQTSGAIQVDGGVKGKCYYFEGDGDCISIPDSEIFDFGNNDFSISTWFKTNANKSPLPFIINFRQNDNNPHIELYAGSDVGSHLLPGSSRLPYPEAGINDDKWHNMTITMDNGAEDGYRLYLDGNKVAQTSYTGKLEDWDTITIGSQGKDTGEQYSFEGFIDEIAIYNRALTEEEVKKYYNTIHGQEPKDELENYQNKEQIILEADVVTIKQPYNMINEYLAKETGLPEAPIYELTETQIQKFKEWAVSFPGTSVVSNQKIYTNEGQSSKLNITSESGFLLKRPDPNEQVSRGQVMGRISEGIVIELTPHLEENENTIVIEMAAETSKTFLPDDSNELPNAKRRNTRATIRIPTEKYVLISVLDAIANYNSFKTPQGDKSTNPEIDEERVFLILKANPQ
ncbi:MAG: hypothetical protein JXA96_17585 [Sedimentisphaerales bacterium]|nr:hypothetical protein [Sedimentisphaerales bacterium]